MANEKIEALLRAALDASPKEREKSKDLSIGYTPQTNRWEIIVKYWGDLAALKLKYPPLIITELLNNYAIIDLPAELIEVLAAEPVITYIEKPKRLFFEVLEGKRASCISALQAQEPTLTGKGVLLAVIDSGIDYAHPDFRNPDGSTRIYKLWDQTLDAIFSEEEINTALSAPTLDERLSICPSQDISGHGTHVTGIAAGNGRASQGTYRGVAYEAELLIVKLGSPNPNGFPSTSLLMEAVDFCVREALERQQPMAINLSFGNTYGSHSGSSLLETYLDSVAQLGRLSIVVGSGNEGVSGGHTGGRLEASQSQSADFGISDFTTSFNLQLWKNYWDEVSLRLNPPSGAGFTLPTSPGTWRYSFGDTEIFAFNGEPTPYNPLQEIYLDFIPRDSYLTPGIWSLTLTPQRIRDGRWDMWLPSAAVRNQATAFLRPTPDTTLTIPSTTDRVITVGAYDAFQNTLAAFSGRGYTWNAQLIKPDLLAPGVDIISCAPGGGYTSRTGTSMATPFVTGTAALFLQWGILLGNDSFLYGEKLKAYLINGARALPGATIPSPEAGWGRLCALDSLKIL